MASFDFGWLDPQQYDLRDPIGACNFQSMVEDFMHIVRADSASLKDKMDDIQAFCKLVADDAAWPLASNVVPEFRPPQ